MRSTTMAAASILAYGEGPLLYGNEDMGFYGPVKSEDFIKPEDLATALGLTAGVQIAGAVTTPWLKFAHVNKTLFIPQMTLRHSLSWNQLNAAGLTKGTRIVTIRGKRYKVRLLNGSGTSNEPRNETKELLAKVFGTSGAWMKLTASAMGVTTGVAGTWSHTNGSESGTATHSIGNGSITNTGNTTKGTGTSTFGWRPVLELVTD